MTEKRPEIAFLETVAAAIINAGSIASMGFVLQHATTKRPYIAWFGEASSDLVVAMAADLARIERLLTMAAEEHGALIEETEHPALIICGAFDGACVLEANHDGYHRDVEDMYFDSEGHLVRQDP